MEEDKVIYSDYTLCWKFYGPATERLFEGRYKVKNITVRQAEEMVESMNRVFGPNSHWMEVEND